jgi:hypothetical protein
MTVRKQREERERELSSHYDSHIAECGERERERESERERERERDRERE